MAKILSVFSEGSLLKRTLFHVGTLVVGTVAFISIASFTLVSIAKGIVPPAGGGASGAASAEVAAGAADEDGEGTAGKSKFGGPMKHNTKKHPGLPLKAE